jgi:ATP-dependent DNA ligase
MENMSSTTRLPVDSYVWSEKFDGVRAKWDSSLGELLTRSGSA